MSPEDLDSRPSQQSEIVAPEGTYADLSELKERGLGTAYSKRLVRILPEEDSSKLKVLVRVEERQHSNKYQVYYFNIDEQERVTNVFASEYFGICSEQEQIPTPRFQEIVDIIETAKKIEPTLKRLV